MERKFISQVDPYANSKIPGWFFVEKDGRREVFFYVPNLEGYGRLCLHEIDRNGGVSPSVRIRGVDKEGNPIEYHQSVILSGWPTGISKPEGQQFI